ncbi:MAG: GtrA family protein [Anaerolineae bacterium]|nr:GtrA family protein [Anaerolineae bacterium]
MIEKLTLWTTQNRKELVRFAKFLVVGTIGAIVDFGILYLLHAVLHWHLALSNTISFTCALTSNFMWNRYWTYPDSRSKPIVSQLGQFYIVNIVGWAINTGILLALNAPFTNLVSNLHLVATAEIAHKIGYNGAKVVATGIVLFWNFFINRFWTYNDV